MKIFARTYRPNITPSQNLFKQLRVFLYAVFIGITGIYIGLIVAEIADILHNFLSLMQLVRKLNPFCPKTYAIQIN